MRTMTRTIALLSTLLLVPAASAAPEPDATAAISAHVSVDVSGAFAAADDAKATAAGIVAEAQERATSAHAELKATANAVGAQAEAQAQVAPTSLARRAADAIHGALDDLASFLGGIFAGASAEVDVSAP